MSETKPQSPSGVEAAREWLTSKITDFYYEWFPWHGGTSEVLTTDQKVIEFAVKCVESFAPEAPRQQALEEAVGIAESFQCIEEGCPMEGCPKWHGEWGWTIAEALRRAAQGEPSNEKG